jgi:hypothetical protein
MLVEYNSRCIRETVFYRSVRYFQVEVTFNDLTLLSSGIGEYMIEWMSKDGGASVDATGSNREGCQQAGICNPVITFFRQGYNLQLYTYESLYQGDDYSDNGPPGLC